MAENIVTEIEFSEARPRGSEWKRFRRVFFSRKIVIFGLVILFLLFFTAIFAQWLAPYNPYKQDLYHVLQQPSSTHIAGHRFHREGYLEPANLRFENNDRSRFCHHRLRRDSRYDTRADCRLLRRIKYSMRLS